MKAELRDALTFIYADSSVGSRSCRSLTLDVARGGIGSVHLLLNDLTVGGKLELSVRRGGRATDEATWFCLIDVPVEVNTGPVGFIEKKGERNDSVARRAPFRVFDAMEPIGRSMKVASPTMALRLHLPTGSGRGPSRREYTIEARQGRQCQALRLVLNVHKAALPPVGKSSFPYTNWFGMSLIAERHGLKTWSEAHWKMISRYADLMAHGRQNTFIVRLPDIFTMKRGRAVLNRERLRRIVKVFTRAGMYFIEGGHFAHRSGNEWKAPTFDFNLTKRRATTIEGNADLAPVALQLMDEIDRNGWRDRWIQHVADEPIPENASDYRILAGMIRRYMPGVPILDATMAPELGGSVDFWCPQIQHYQKRRKQFDALRAHGDRIWYYTCCFPGGPWLNRLLDMELLRPALLGWAGALFDLHGFLHWGLNHYRRDQDPFKKSVVGHTGGSHLPAGDTHIVYPGQGRPWSSVRLEAHREGFEDCDLLLKLRRRDKKLALGVIRKAVRGFDAYTKDVKVFRAAKRAMLKAAE